MYRVLIQYFTFSRICKREKQGTQFSPSFIQINFHRIKQKINEKYKRKSGENTIS